MNSRVRLIRESLKLNQYTFANRLGISGPGISKIEGGHRKVTDRMVLTICKEYNINERWLRFGEGEMYRKPLPNGIEDVANFYHFDEMDRRIFYEYIQMDEKKRNVIKEYIKKIAFGCSEDGILKDGNDTADILKCAEESEMK